MVASSLCVRGILRQRFRFPPGEYREISHLCSRDCTLQQFLVGDPFNASLPQAMQQVQLMLHVHAFITFSYRRVWQWAN